MATNARNTNRQSAPAANDGDNRPVVEVTGEQPGGRNTVTNMFTEAAVAENARITEKLKMLSEVKADLHEAAKLMKAGDRNETKARETAASAGLRLYQGRVANILAADEVTAILGAEFGFKITPKTGKPSKTPFGLGEIIRKRVVRLYDAAEYATGTGGSTFFAGLDRDAVGSVLTGIEREKDPLTIWQAFDRLTELKSEANENNRIKAAFDPKRVRQIVDSLCEAGAGDVVRKNPRLVSEYGALIRVLNLIGQGATPKEVEQAHDEIIAARVMVAA